MSERLLIIPDFFILLKCLEKEKKTASDIQLETKMTYAHLHNLKHEMIELGWVTIEQDGIKKYMVLTPKAKSILIDINGLLKKLGIAEEEVMLYRRQPKNGGRKMEEENKVEETQEETEETQEEGAEETSEESTEESTEETPEEESDESEDSEEVVDDEEIVDEEEVEEDSEDDDKDN